MNAWRWAALALAVAGTWRVAATHAVFSPTFDEEYHLACGVHWWDRGSTTTEVQHPPLSRILLGALPYWAGARSGGQVNVIREGQSMTGFLGLPRGIVLARRGVLVLFPVLCLGVWLWTREWRGDGAAAFAVASVSLLPPVLAHAGLATTDIAVTAFFPWAMWLAWRWCKRRTLSAAHAAGLAFGLAMGSKFTALLFVPVALAVLLACEWRTGRRPPRPVLQWLMALSATLFVLLALYRFQPHRPLSEVVAGLRWVWDHSREGHWSYLLFEVRLHGWWYFFPVVFGVKTPLAFLGLIGLSLGVARARPLVAAAAAIMLVSSFSGINLGIRHLLPLYPLLAVAAGIAFDRFRYPAIALLACLAAVSLRAAPDYLAEFNLLAGARPEMVRVDSDLDWGQDMFRLAERCRALKVPALNAAISVPFDPESLGLPPTVTLTPDQKSSGWVAVSLTRKMMHNAKDGTYQWLDAYRPVERVGKTIDLYYLRNPEWPDRAAALDRYAEYQQADAPSWGPVLHIDKALQPDLATGDYRVFNWDGFEYHGGLKTGIAWIGSRDRYLRARVWARRATTLRVLVKTDTGFSRTDEKRRLELASNGKSLGLRHYEAPAKIDWIVNLDPGVTEFILRTPDVANLPLTADGRDFLIKILGIYLQPLQ